MTRPKTRYTQTEADLFAPAKTEGKHLPTIFMGVDPGASGGVAVIRQEDHTGIEWIRTHPMPKDEQSILDVLSHYATRYSVFAVVEAVTGYVASKLNDGAAGGDTLGAKGGGRANSHNSFTFGQNFGALKMALCAVGIPYTLVAAKTWQKGIHISPRKSSESKSEWKNRLKSFAVDLFAHHGAKAVITLKTCDALLIAEYARRLYSQDNREGKKCR
jgi:hypothetical protein